MAKINGGDLMKFKKAIAAVVMGMVLVLSLGGLAGCADNSQEVITESLEQELEQLRNPDQATISDLASNLPASTFAQLGLSPDEVVRAIMDGFDGTVDSVEVDGSNAQAVVTLSSKDFSQFEDLMEDITDSMMDDPEQFAGMSQSEISQWVGQQMMEQLNALPVVEHDPMTIDYVRNGNTWEPAPGAEAKLTAALFS